MKSVCMAKYSILADMDMDMDMDMEIEIEIISD